MSRCAKWTESEDNIIKEFYPSEGSAVKHRLHGRTDKAVMHRARFLGVNYCKRVSTVCRPENYEDVMIQLYSGEITFNEALQLLHSDFNTVRRFMREDEEAMKYELNL